jgi:RimJ/RimL family protein N-acetyltransferase
MLGDQLPALPPLQGFLDELPNLFGWLDGTVASRSCHSAMEHPDLPVPVRWGQCCGVAGIGLRHCQRRTTIFGVEPVQVTERLALRQFTAADARDLQALDGDPQVMRFLEPTIKSRAQIQAEVLPRLLACYDRYPGFGFWAAHTRTGGAFIGWFGLRPVTPTAGPMVDWPDAPPGDTAVTSLGYRLRASAWAGGTSPGTRPLMRHGAVGVRPRSARRTVAG